MKHLRVGCWNTYHQIYEVQVDHPEFVLPIEPRVIKDSRKIFTGAQGPIEAQLCTFGASWRFWVVINEKGELSL